MGGCEPGGTRFDSPLAWSVFLPHNSEQISVGGHFEVTLGSFRDRLGIILRMLGSFWGRFGIVLGIVLGSFWCRLGIVLG